MKIKLKLWASLTEAWSPHVIIFFLFPLCSSFRMTPWNTGDLLAFCVNQGRTSLFLSPFTFPITDAVILRESLDPAGAGPRQSMTTEAKLYTWEETKSSLSGV